MARAEEILAAAIEAVNPELAEKVRKEKKWRFGYVKHLINMVEALINNATIPTPIPVRRFTRQHDNAANVAVATCKDGKQHVG